MTFTINQLWSQCRSQRRSPRVNRFTAKIRHSPMPSRINETRIASIDSPSWQILLPATPTATSRKRPSKKEADCATTPAVRTDTCSGPIALAQPFRSAVSLQCARVPEDGAGSVERGSRVRRPGPGHLCSDGSSGTCRYSRFLLVLGQRLSGKLVRLYQSAS